MIHVESHKHKAESARVLLVNPPSGLYRRDDRCQSRVEDQAVRVVLPPVDLALLAAVARLAGAEPRIRDYPAMGVSWDRYAEDLEEFKPRMVVFDVTTATLQSDLDAARLAKQHDPGIQTVARGEIFEREGEEILRRRPDLDLALYGEPEEVFRRLLEGEEVRDLPSTVHRVRRPESSGPEDLGDSIEHNTERAVVENLDSLPLPARDLLDNSLYLSPETGRPLTVVKANRGCFAQCIFCPAGSIGNHKFRLRSPDSILEELRECVEKFQIREFLFDGDTFTIDKPWLLELCRRIEEEKLDIRWGCNSRVDTMDRERAKALVRAGCVLTAFGVESGDQAMLDHMKKGARLDRAERAVAACKEAGLGTHAFYIVGLPWETRETLKRTFAFARKLDTDFFDINIATPLPGTEFHEIALREGLMSSDSADGGNYANARVRSRELSAQYLTRWRRRALLRLYLRPRYVVRTLARARRLGLTRHYLKAAFQRLGSLLNK